MKRLIMTGCLAVALAFGPQNAAPAKAFEGEEIIGIVLGLAALAALAQEFDRDDDKKGHKYRPIPMARNMGIRSTSRTRTARATIPCPAVA